MSDASWLVIRISRNYRSYRWQIINGSHPPRSWYVLHTLANWYSPDQEPILVDMQETASKINKMERSSSSNPAILSIEAETCLKVTSWKGMSETGSRLQIHQQITTLRVRPTRPELQNGSSRGMCSLSGKKGDLSYGYMENVNFF